MSNLSVVFTVKDDIIRKIKRLSGANVMEFILGCIEDDYFEKHFLSIEDIGECWKYFFEYLNEYKTSSMNLQKHILFEDEQDMVFIEGKRATKYILSILENASSDNLNQFYLRKYISSELFKSNFEYHFDMMKAMCSRAVIDHGSLLFCIDKL